MKKRKNIAILGSTGSIGRSSLEVIAACPDRFRLTYLTGHRNIELLREQVKRFKPRGVVVREEGNAALLRERMNGSIEVLAGEEGLREIVSRDDVDMVISSLVGFAGLKPTVWALDAGKDVALANKETLVTGGEIIMRKVRKNHVRLLPVDSEHSAILQCLQGEDPDSIARLILTASGGPFLHLDKKKFSTITRAQALAHPTWKMGSKVTIDSATLMNKGLEVIEAYWLFGLPAEKIDVVVHPQSIIHSMVEFVDGSIKAQLGVPDMRIPIQYALTFPDRSPASYGKVNFAALRQMTFFEPDREKFRCLGLAYQALRTGGTAPAVLNAANEVAVELFLEGNLPFSSIPDIIDQALCNHKSVDHPRLEDIVRADKETRERLRGLYAPAE